MIISFTVVFSFKSHVSDLFTRSLKAATLLLLLMILSSTCNAAPKKTVDFGHLSQEKIEQLLNTLRQIPDPGQKVAFISSLFLETPYRGNTLIGSSGQKEELVIRLDGVDCFTLLDYVETLRRISCFAQFKKTLIHIRYRKNTVAFLNRNHFFSSWGTSPSALLRNVTSLVGGKHTRWVIKQLNQKKEGNRYLPGYPIKQQKIAFIPPAAIDEALLNHLKSGDYIGIYSPLLGLDVSHTGIIVKQKGSIFFRHASSKQQFRQVTDEELLPYLARKKGLVVYRPMDVGNLK